MTEEVRFFVSSGKVAIDFSGFEGDTCVDCANTLKEKLEQNGITLNLEKLIRKETETETVRERNEISH